MGLTILRESDPLLAIGETVSVKISKVYVVVTSSTSSLFRVEKKGNHERLDEESLRNIAKFYT